MVTRTPSSGQISMSDVNLALTGKNSTDTVSLNDTAVRSLAGAGYTTNNSTISMSVLYGKISSTVISPTLSGSTNTNYVLRNAAISAGWDGVTPLVMTVTLSSGAVLGSSSTGGYAFDTGYPFPTGSVLTLINNGYIVGAGGAGGAGGAAPNAGNSGSSGGPSMHIQYPISITNNGTIGGGGGGGGGGGCFNYLYESGGSGGGGAGYVNGQGGPFVASSLYSNGNAASYGAAGNPGTITSGGSGGAGGVNAGPVTGQAGSGGAGGNLGLSGTLGGSSDASGGGGGSAGAAILGYSKITWNTRGTISGATSG